MFKDKYTTQQRIDEQNSMLSKLSLSDLEDTKKYLVSEEKKIILSNDAYALGEALEALTNAMRFH